MMEKETTVYQPTFFRKVKKVFIVIALELLIAIIILIVSQIM